MEDVNKNIKEQGELTREGDTNSLKSLNGFLQDKYDKFQGIFETMEGSLTKQVGLLENIFGINQDQREDFLRQERLLSLKEKGGGDSPSFPSGYDTDGNYKLGPDDLSEDNRRNILDSVSESFGGFALAIPAAMSGIIGRLGMVGLAAVLAGPAEDFLKGFITESLDTIDFDSLDIDISDSAKETISNELSSAVKWGVIGKVIGNRLGLAVGAGGFIFEAIGRNLDDSESSIAQKLKENFSSEQIQWIGSALGGVLALSAPSLMRMAFTGTKQIGGKLIGSISSGLSGGMRSTFAMSARSFGSSLGSIFSGASRTAIGTLNTVNGGLIPALKKPFGLAYRNSFIGKAGAIGGAIGLLAGTAALASVEDPDFQNYTSTSMSNAISGALLGGQLGGPWGAVIGAIAGIALTGAIFLKNKFFELNEEMNDRLSKEVKDLGADEIISRELDKMAPSTAAGESAYDTAKIRADVLKDKRINELINNLNMSIDETSGRGSETLRQAIVQKVNSLMDRAEKLEEDGITTKERAEITGIKTELSQLIPFLKKISNDEFRSDIIGETRDYIENIVKMLKFPEVSMTTPTGNFPSIGDIPMNFGESDREITMRKINSNMDENYVSEKQNPVNVALKGGDAYRREGDKINNSQVNIYNAKSVEEGLKPHYLPNSFA